ncbi:MAG: hydrogenase 3 maturation endopeptidase HyCI [Acidobacteria bacterium]|nr:MAG: hydrogenase 3 maturation endopeptidase HyCI [Acidobacteriota bacterium]
MNLKLPSPRPARGAIRGVGNEMKGDDGAGVRVVRELSERMPATPGVLLINAGQAPENFTGPLRRFRPDLVIEVDAADQGAEPGTVAWVDWRDADGMSASTHTLPPSVLASFLAADLGCEVALIGIQPATLDLDAPLSPAVARAVSELAGTLSAWLDDQA